MDLPLFSIHKTAEEVGATEVEVAEVTNVVSDGVGVITSLETEVEDASGVLVGVLESSGVLVDSGVEDEGGVVNDSKVEDTGVGVREGVKMGVVETSERTKDGEDGEATEDRVTHLAAAPPKREPKTRAGRRSIMDLIRSGIKERREMSVGEVTNVGRKFDFQVEEYQFLRTKNEQWPTGEKNARPQASCFCISSP